MVLGLLLATTKENLMRFSKLTYRLCLLAATATALVAVSGVAALAGRGHARSLPRPHARASAAALVSALNRPVAGNDVLDPSFAASLNAFAQRSGHPAIDWNDARQLVAGVWVATSGDDLCLHVGSDSNGVVGCGASDELMHGQGPFVSGQRARSQPYTIGLVPDGVDNVSLHLTDGTTATVPVVNNIYKLAAPAPADGLNYQSPIGPVSEELPAASLH